MFKKIHNLVHKVIRTIYNNGGRWGMLIQFKKVSEKNYETEKNSSKRAMEAKRLKVSGRLSGASYFFLRNFRKKQLETFSRTDAAISC